MTNNKQRRDAAKRKLERQLARRAQRQRQQRQRLIIGGIILVLLVGGGITWLVTRSPGDSSTEATGSSETTPPVEPCTYTTDGVAPAVRPVSLPPNTAPLNSGIVDVDMMLNGTAVPITLNRELAPCSVNSFLSLAVQDFFDGTSCWRLTTHPEMKILQCGDPSGQGNGGPGYTVPLEAGADTAYPRGTVALASSSGRDTGSQFFITTADSPGIPANYTVIGSIADADMGPVDAIAEAGLAGERPSGKPVADARIDDVTYPSDALDGTGDYSTPEADPTEELLPTG